MFGLSLSSLLMKFSCLSNKCPLNHWLKSVGMGVFIWGFHSMVGRGVRPQKQYIHLINIGNRGTTESPSINASRSSQWRGATHQMKLIGQISQIIYTRRNWTNIDIEPEIVILFTLQDFTGNPTCVERKHSSQQSETFMPNMPWLWKSKWM